MAAASARDGSAAVQYHATLRAATPPGLDVYNGAKNYVRKMISCAEGVKVLLLDTFTVRSV